MGRIAQTNSPDGGQVTRTYFTSSFPFSVTTAKKLDASRNIVSQLYVDGLARIAQGILCEDGPTCSQQIKTDTTYDGNGRKSTASNPYRSTTDTTYGISTTKYDALDRVTKVIPPDGSVSANNVATVYAGNCTTVTDQAGKIRKSCTDALGRLIQVFEPNSSNSLIYETDYQYDVLNNLLRVDQRATTPIPRTGAPASLPTIRFPSSSPPTIPNPARSPTHILTTALSTPNSTQEASPRPTLMTSSIA
jgi:hypothetical protein